ncbi:MAG TPA: GNAT family N-acetyltransferase [Saprospiraceae bacterium]|nr:GNAT family N-acetyltransferase [Saprospiraceae bacterium]
MRRQDYIETERTILRRLTIDDAEEFYALNLDTEVLKYTGDKPFENIQISKDFLTNYDQYEKYGVGRLAIIEKATSRFTVWCGLKYSPDKDEYDIGFRFFRDYWNKGFATETAKRCLDFGFNELGIGRVVGRAMKENNASIKVLEKIEMTFKETFDFEGHEGVIYERRNNDNENQSPNRYQHLPKQT